MELPSPPAFAFLLVASTILSLVVFRHAERHGSRHPYAWGITTFLGGLIAVTLYFAHYWLARRR